MMVCKRRAPMFSILEFTSAHGDVFRPEKGGILPCEGIFWLKEYSLEVFRIEGFQLDTKRETALELGNEVARAGYVERPGGYKEDVRGIHNTVLGIHRGPFHDGKNVTLNALARNILIASPLAFRGDLVDFVDKYDLKIIR